MPCSRTTSLQRPSERLPTRLTSEITLGAKQSEDKVIGTGAISATPEPHTTP